jgi:hypothetical protein
LPIMCMRCSKRFPTESDLAAHLRVPDPCVWQEAPVIEGITAEQEKKLKRRQRLEISQSEEAKWMEIYRILFPDEHESNLPSPCKNWAFLNVTSMTINRIYTRLRIRSRAGA